METLITISLFFIFSLIIVFPILLLTIFKKFKTKETLVIYSLMSIFVLGSLIFLFAWWSDRSDMFLLEHFGYNYNALNETERFQNVAQENLEKVKRLETSIMGIGWTLKAIFGYVIIVPYLLFVYISKILIDKPKKAKLRNQ